MFRNLRADEIELRVGTATAKGFSLLLYKDARCDMNILDETVGAMNWTRSHSRDNANCVVSIWDSTKEAWISKEDTGAESFTEKEKGLASDSFKRACVNWGIGRELYTAPFIWIKDHTYESNGKYKTDGYDRELKVSIIEYDEKNCIKELVITDKTSKVVFKSGEKSFYEMPKEEPKKVNEQDRPRLVAEISELIGEYKLDTHKVYAKAGVNNLNEIATSRLPGMIDWLNGLDANKRKELM